MEFNPAFIDVTYHREEYVYIRRENQLLEKVTVKKRPGTVGICAAVSNRFKVDTVPHFICGGFTKAETENALHDLHFLGIENVLALRGDPIKTEGVFKPEPDGNAYAVDLVKQISNMNKGVYLEDDGSINEPTDFCIGVAGYAEKHFEAPSFNADIKRMKEKIAAGADYVVTQMFFDNQKYFDFVNTCREEGITVPIIPGLKPITSKAQLFSLPRIFYIDMPDDLVEALEGASDNAAAKQVGIEWCINQSKELMKFGVPCLHYYSMSRSDAVYQIGKELF